MRSCAHNLHVHLSVQSQRHQSNCIYYIFRCTGQLIPQPLARRSQLPAQLPSNSTLDREGATYSWLYQQIFNLLGWAPCPLSSPSEPIAMHAVAVVAATASCQHYTCMGCSTLVLAAATMEARAGPAELQHTLHAMQYVAQADRSTTFLLKKGG
jgi:hypothetical protein